MLKVQILGSGGAARKHREAFETLPNLYEIVDAEPDIIDICTPNHLHFLQAGMAPPNGCHAIVEKPVCGSLSDCNTLAGVERGSGKRICPIFQYRFAGHASLLGTIQSRWLRHPHYWNGWRGQWDTALGGCLTSHGIHIIDLLIQKHGMPDSVVANIFGKIVERTADIILNWPDRSVNLEVILGPNVEQGGFDLGNSAAGYRRQFMLLYEALTYDTEMPVTLAQARQVIEVLTAAYYSAYTGEPATLPIGPDHPFHRGWQEHLALPKRKSRSSHLEPEPLDHPAHEPV